MSDYSEAGAQPVEDAVVPDPPTEAEVLAAQAERYPDQAATRLEGHPATDADADAGTGLDRHPADGELPSDVDVQAERQAEGEAAEDAAAPD